MSKPTDLVPGTPDLLILRILALEPPHGWAIGRRPAGQRRIALSCPAQVVAGGLDYCGMETKRE